MIKVGDTVTLNIDYPDNNSALPRGSTGYVLKIDDVVSLVRWDNYNEIAEGNDSYLDNYFVTRDEDRCYTDEFYDNSGHLWWVNTQFLLPINSLPPFRAKKKEESSTTYRISKKIYELDIKWKERHANSGYISVQNEQHKCSLPG